MKAQRNFFNLDFGKTLLEPLLVFTREIGYIRRYWKCVARSIRRHRSCGLCLQYLYKCSRKKVTFIVNQIVLTGMVLSVAPVGEYDRRVVILTKEQGKISAFAKGSRRPNSPLVGAVNPFTFGEFTMYEGRSSYTIQSVNVSNYFSELRADVVGAYYGFYFLEVANYYARERNDERELLKLLYQTMRALTNPHLPNQLIRYIFELKVLTINGQGPQVFQCVQCGDRTRAAVFSAAKGGLVCNECDGEVRDGMFLDGSTLYTMQYIESSTIEKLYTFNVKPEVVEKFGRVMGRLMKMYVDKEFKSLEILETLL